MNEVKINMKKYCKDCNVWEPDFHETKLKAGDGTVYSITEVLCRNRDLCDHLEKKMMEELRGKDESRSKTSCECGCHSENNAEKSCNCGENGCQKGVISENKSDTLADFLAPKMFSGLNFIKF